MLEYYFKHKSSLLRLRREPLAEHLDGLARELHQKGYRPSTAQNLLSILGRFNSFARLQGITSASQVDDTLAERFLTEELAPEGYYHDASSALMHMTDYLQRMGVTPMPSDDRLEDPDDALLVRFDYHLRDVRGLTKLTRQGCLRGARVANIPSRLTWKQVRALIDSIDISTAVGKRDKAIILLIVTLGLRSNEIRSLKLDHIAWKSSELHLPQTKRHRERILPLTREVGEALVDYILNGRPQSDHPEVFLTQIAPRGSISGLGTVGCVVKRCLRKAGLTAPPVMPDSLPSSHSSSTSPTLILLWPAWCSECWRSKRSTQ